jgi:DnaA-homolog protein
MKQLSLDISAPPPPTFANFSVGRNQELLTLLQAVAASTSNERFVYVWGDPGAGKSHLLRAVAAAKRGNAVLLDAEAAIPEISQIRGDELVVVDDVHRLRTAVQASLFHAYNRLRSASGRLVASGGVAPAQLILLPDLKSRLSWGLALQVHPLSDEEKFVVLAQHAEARGFTLSPEVLRYISSHYQRDVPSLMGLLQALDRYSLETKRAITVPLLKEVIDHTVES